MNITAYSVELIKDPFGILAGDRYEFMLDLDIPEDDELYTDNGVYARVIYCVDEARSYIVKHELYERSTDKYLDFELTEEELEPLALFCREHAAEAVE